MKAQIRNLTGLSSHADQDDLIHWLSKLQKAPEKIFIVHGEKEGSEALRHKIKETYGWLANIPEMGQTISLA